MSVTRVMERCLRADDARADGAQREIAIARGEILIRRRVGGIEMKVGVPARAYLGVVLSLLAGGEGRSWFRVSLWHGDPDLIITLHEAHDDRDIVAEWKAWARFFGLPKFIEREPGRLEGAEARLGEVALGRREGLRRRGATISKRRPRLLTRRKPGDADRAQTVIRDERVIIARH